MPVDDADLFSVLQAKLRRYPHVRYEAAPDQMRILPLNQDGFRIDVVLHAQVYSVWFEGWYKQFQSAADAIECIELALSESARLEVWVRGNTQYRWIFQRRSERGWDTVGARSAVFRPFWRRRRVLHLQNQLLEAA